MISSAVTDDFVLNLASAAIPERDSSFLSPEYAIFVPQQQNAGEKLCSLKN